METLTSKCDRRHDGTFADLLVASDSRIEHPIRGQRSTETLSQDNQEVRCQARPEAKQKTALLEGKRYAWTASQLRVRRVD